MSKFNKVFDVVTSRPVLAIALVIAIGFINDLYRQINWVRRDASELYTWHEELKQESREATRLLKEDTERRLIAGAKADDHHQTRINSISDSLGKVAASLIVQKTASATTAVKPRVSAAPQAPAQEVDPLDPAEIRSFLNDLNGFMGAAPGRGF